MAGAFGLSELSPQIGATSYGRGMPYLDRGAAVEAQAELLPQIYEQEAREKAYNEQMAMQRQSIRDARRDANISLGIKGTELAYNVSQNPLAQRYGKGVVNALRPKPWQAPATDLAPVNYMQPAPAASGTSVPLNMPLVPDAVPTPMTLPNIDPFQNAPVVPQESSMLNMGGTRLASNMPRGTVSDTGASFMTSAGETGMAPVMTAPAPTASPSLLSQAAGYKGLTPFASGAANAGLQMGLGAAANYAIERSNFGETLHKGLGGGEKEWNLAGSSLASFAIGGPVGLGMNLAFAGAKEFGKKNCIIVTACHGADSDEVKVAKKFRDANCSRNELRGYYVYADRLVPLMEAHDDVREFIKTTLVDHLLAYARWYMGEVKEKPCAATFATVKNFRQFCLDTGATMKEYTRSNGEVV